MRPQKITERGKITAKQRDRGRNTRKINTDKEKPSPSKERRLVKQRRQNNREKPRRNTRLSTTERGGDILQGKGNSRKEIFWGQDIREEKGLKRCITEGRIQL